MNARGGRLSRRSIQRAVRDVLEKAAADQGLSVHSLRHSFATHLLDAGADLMAVKELWSRIPLHHTDLHPHLQGAVEEGVQTGTSPVLYGQTLIATETPSLRSSGGYSSIPHSRRCYEEA